MNIHKVMIISDGMFQINKRLLGKVNKQFFMLESSSRLWLLFLDQPQADVVVSEIIYFQIYKILAL